jgi:hypothetical protein
MATVRPLISAYLRTGQGWSGQELAQARHELIVYAHREGFTVAAFFVERPGLRHGSALGALVESIESTGVRDVVAPSLTHFGPAGRDRRAIERQLGACLWVIRQPPETTRAAGLAVDGSPVAIRTRWSTGGPGGSRTT